VEAEIRRQDADATAKALNTLYELELNSEKRAHRRPVEIVNPFGGPDATAKIAPEVDREVAVNAREVQRRRRLRNRTDRH
jgi:hypothetical protein